jgi:hypothetical protein
MAVLDGAATAADVVPRTLQPVLSQNSELRNTDVFLAPLTLFFSNFTLGRRPSLLVFVPIALTLTLHFLGTNSLVVGFRSKTVCLSLKC